MGRRREGTATRNVRFRREQLDTLSEVAAAQGLSVSAVIRRAVDREVARLQRGGAKRRRAA